jgi:hypothetical protein
MEKEIVCLKGSIREEVGSINLIYLMRTEISPTKEELLFDNIIRNELLLNGDLQVTKENNGCQ